MKPQYIEITKAGNKFYYSDKAMTISHRVDGPAAEYKDGLCIWYLNGKKHREDGPAVTWLDGSNEWWLLGQLHRTDGPAIDTVGWPKQWYLHGTQYTERDHTLLFQLDCA